MTVEVGGGKTTLQFKNHKFRTLSLFPRMFPITSPTVKPNQPTRKATLFRTWFVQTRLTARGAEEWPWLPRNRSRNQASQRSGSYLQRLGIQVLLDQAWAGAANTGSAWLIFSEPANSKPDTDCTESRIQAHRAREIGVPEALPGCATSFRDPHSEGPAWFNAILSSSWDSLIFIFELEFFKWSLVRW